MLVQNQPQYFFDYYEYGTDNVYHFWTAEPVLPDSAVNNWGISMNYGDYFANDDAFDWSRNGR